MKERTHRSMDDLGSNVVALIALTVSLLLAHPTAAEESAPHRNVVLILIDDLSHYGVTAYGANRIRSLTGRFPDQEFETPVMDELARTGLRVDHAFAHPLCENTRVALMTGMGNERNYLRPKSLHASAITFGDTFQRAGYATGLFGKWKQSRGTSDVPAKDYLFEFGWDDWAAFDVVGEGQRFINPNLVINGKVFNYAGRTDLDPATGRRWYGPDIVNRRALEFIDRHQDEPFFLYYPMMLVHDDHKPTPDSRPKSVFDSFDEVHHNRDGHTGDDHKYFPDMLAYTDKLIGQVVAKLDELKIREQTLIVVMGDNGTKETFAHILPDGTVYPGRKGGNADNGLHVPLILNLPGVVPSKGSDEVRSYQGLVDMTDIYPTIAEAADVAIPNADELDGISFWPQAMGEPGEPRTHIYRWFIGNNTYRDHDKVLRFAFDRDSKRYAPSKHYPEGRFFDLTSDLLERVGDRSVELKWKVMRFSGLEVSKLSPSQRRSYDRLGRVVDANAMKPVERLEIVAKQESIAVGETQLLEKRVYPQNASRRGVVWESSDPAIATVNKFGEVVGKQAGQVTISMYSWDDAEPVAAGRNTSYQRGGLKAEVTITVL